MSINTISDGWQLREYSDGEYFLDPIGVGGRGYFNDAPIRGVTDPRR